jgi:hypothetical protein
VERAEDLGWVLRPYAAAIDADRRTTVGSCGPHNFDGDEE